MSFGIDGRFVFIGVHNGIITQIKCNVIFFSIHVHNVAH
jgi:hypothetical protein